MDSLGWAIPKSVNLIAGMPHSTTFINSCMFQSYCGLISHTATIPDHPRLYHPHFRYAQTSLDHNIGNSQILGLSGKSDNLSSTQILPALVGTCQLKPVWVFTGGQAQLVWKFQSHTNNFSGDIWKHLGLSGYLGNTVTIAVLCYTLLQLLHNTTTTTTTTTAAAAMPPCLHPTSLKNTAQIQF
ncbi:hypothetical protein BDP27DRAFT_1486893 [Rhodocollybia butyracea]|uniref:Uncharacterized protein n=1 Tax=Rhodocollybia butyracea TaxID=206335 RepID=A0A9P5UG80_9AGAR|nr:hypothetical protein BDP27DRAFT_1486893 [Rhodocollybia butyracea]